MLNAIIENDLYHEHPKIALLLDKIGVKLSSLNEPDDALQFLNESLKVGTLVHGSDHPNLLFTMTHIGQVYQKAGMYNQAIKVYHSALKKTKMIFDIDNTFQGFSISQVTSTLLINMGASHYKMENDAHAKRATEYAILLQKQELGDVHPDVALLLHNIGVMQFDSGALSDAIISFNESLKLRRIIFGNENQHVAESLFRIGNVYEEIGDYDKTLEVFAETIHVMKTSLGNNHPDTATVLFRIGNIKHIKKQFDMALKAYNDGLCIAKMAFGEENDLVAGILHKIGTIQHERGAYSEASIAFSESSRILSIVTGTSKVSIEIRMLQQELASISTGHPPAGKAA